MKAVLVAIVDDDPGLCSSLVDLMRSAGYRAEAFLSAELFLAASAAHGFDRVILDIRMPGMNGLDLLRRLQAQGTMPPVVVITALRDEGLNELAIDAGARCLLRKPFDSEALLDSLDSDPAEGSA